MSGNLNRLLTIDLGSGQTEIKNLPPEEFRTYIGGSALAARLFFEAGGHEINPLAAESPLFITTGPLVGTNFPGSSRFSLCARSPLTGIWGESACGGFFGAELKKAGFDGVILNGKAPKPSYILIEDGQAVVSDAADLWGQDTYTTVDKLKKRHSGKSSARVLTIGPAGENLVKYAAVCHDKAHYFGRAGIGAVMGSKNLKAVVARGSDKVSIADEAKYQTVRKAALATIKESLITASFHDLGTAAAMDMGMLTGDVPIKNWSLGGAEEMAAALGGPAIHEKMLKGRKACYACPIGCKPVVAVDTPVYAVAKGPGPEYETCAAFGTMIMNANLDALAYINSLCNRLGLDTISCGATVAFIMDCFENNLLSREDLDGLQLDWGNVDAVIALVKKIAARDGFGNRAAEGSLALARDMGQAALDLSVTVKGLEVPMHDPRAFHGLGLAYMNSNRGACHMQHIVQGIEQGMISWPEIGLEEDYVSMESQGKAKMVYICENVGQLTNAVSICQFVHWAMGMNHLLEGFNAVTGYDFDMETFIKAGERAWVLKRALNNLMGISAAADRLPKKILTPLTEGEAAGSIPDEALMRNKYYQIRGLDDKGVPTPELLKTVGLGWLQEKLHR
jgi:aldehyde:ferredoxin oxidoreductase